MKIIYPLKKIIALLTLIAFSSQSAVWALPGGPVSFSKPAEFRAERPNIRIPAQWGEIKESYDNPSAGSFVVHIQNAHGNYRAQRNIQKMINLLHKKHKVRSIFLEGANDKLDPAVFRFFEDNRLNLKVGDLLMRQGEFTGAEMFLLGQGEEGAGGAEGYGIEDTELYRRDFELFRKVMGEKEKTEAFFKEWDKSISRAESRIFSKELRGFVKEWRKFKSASDGLLSYTRHLRQYGLKYLSLDLKDPKHQAEYGALLRILKLKEIEGRLDGSKISAEKKALLEFLRDKIDKKIYRKLERLDPYANKKPAGRPEQAADGPGYPRFLFEKIMRQALPKGLDFKKYPNFVLFAEYLILESEIDSQRLFEETERFSEELFKALAKTAEEKKLSRLILDSELLRKLLTLELSRSEHKKILSGKEALAPVVLKRRLAALFPEKEKISAAAAEADRAGPFSEALEFYALALEREKYFLQKTTEVMREKNETLSVIVTGGFHAEGVLRLLSEKGIPYISIMPRMTQAEQGHAIYLRAMMGETRIAETAQIEKALRELSAPSREKLVGPELSAADHALDLQAVQAVAASLGTEALSKAAVARALRYVFYSELPAAQKKQLKAKLEEWGYQTYSAGWNGDLDALVAFSGPNPAGLQAFMLHRESSSVYATGLYVDKEFRRNGHRVGSRVREELLSRLKEVGFKEFNIPGIDKTEEAQKFHKRWLAELGDSVIEVIRYPEDSALIKSIAVDLNKFQPARAAGSPDRAIVAASLGAEKKPEGAAEMTGEVVSLDDFQELSFAAVQPQQYVTLKGKLYGEDYVIRVFQDREAWKYELSVWNKIRNNPKLWFYLPQTSAAGVLKARDSGKISKLFDKPSHKASIRLKTGAPFLAFRIPNGILMQEHQRYLYALNQVGAPFPAGSQAMVIPVLRHAAEVLSAFQEEGFLYAKGEYSPADFSVNPDMREVILMNPGQLVQAAKSGPGELALEESMQAALHQLVFGYTPVSKIMHPLAVRLYQYVNRSPDNTADGSIRLSLKWMQEVFIPLLERGAEIDAWLEEIEGRLKRGDAAARAELESRASSSDDIDPVSRALMVQVLNRLHKKDVTEFDFTRLYEQGYEEFSHRGARYLFVLRRTGAGDYAALDAYQVLGRGPENPRIIHAGYIDAFPGKDETVISRLNWESRINASVFKPATLEYLKTRFGLDEPGFMKTFEPGQFLQGQEVTGTDAFDQWPALEVREDYRGLKLGQLLFASMLGLAMKERRPLIRLEEVGPVDFYTPFIAESQRANAVAPEGDLPDITFRVPDGLNLKPSPDFEINRDPAGKITFIIGQSLGLGQSEQGVSDADKFRQITLEDLSREGAGGKHLFLSFYTGDGKIEWFQIGLDGRVRYFRHTASFDSGGQPESKTDISWKWLAPSESEDAAILNRPEVKIFTDQIKEKAGQPMLLVSGVATGLDAVIFPDGTAFPVSYIGPENQPLIDLSLKLTAKTYPDLQRAREVREFLSSASLGQEAAKPGRMDFAREAAVFVISTHLNDALSVGLLVGVPFGLKAGLLAFIADLSFQAIKLSARLFALKDKSVMVQIAKMTMIAMFFFLAASGFVVGSSELIPFLKILAVRGVFEVLAKYSLGWRVRLMKMRDALQGRKTMLYFGLTGLMALVKLALNWHLVKAILLTWIGGPLFFPFFWAAVYIHEQGHYLMGKIIQRRYPGQIKKINFHLWNAYVLPARFTAFSLAPKNEAKILLAGPLMSLAAGLIVWHAGGYLSGEHASLIRGFAAVNFTMFLANSLLLGSDGQRFFRIATKDQQIRQELETKYSHVFSDAGNGAEPFSYASNYLVQSGNDVYWVGNEQKAMPATKRTFIYNPPTEEGLSPRFLHGVLVKTDQGEAGFRHSSFLGLKHSFYAVYKISDFPQEFLAPPAAGASLGQEKAGAWFEERDRVAGEIFEKLKAETRYEQVREKATRPGRNGINPPDYTDIWDFSLAELSGKKFTAERRDIVNRVIDLVKQDGLAAQSLGVLTGAELPSEADAKTGRELHMNLQVYNLVFQSPQPLAVLGPMLDKSGLGARDRYVAEEMVRRLAGTQGGQAKYSLALTAMATDHFFDDISAHTGRVLIGILERQNKIPTSSAGSLGVSAEEDAVFARLGEALAAAKPDALLPLTVDRLARENARHLVNEARQNQQPVEALTVCTANYHRSASMDWLLKIAGKKEGLEDFRVNSGGTALWDSGEMTNVLIPQGLRGVFSGLNPGLLSRLLLVTGSPELMLEAPDFLSAAALTDEHLRQLYFRFDETAWRNRVLDSGLPEDEQRPYLETVASAAGILRSFDQQLASEQRLDNRVFRETASKALSAEDRPALAEAQQSYGAPKTITRTMIDNATVIIVAGEEHKRMIEYYFPDAAHKTFLFTELAPEVFPGRKDVPDPGKGEIRERDLFETLSRNIERAVYPLFQKQEPRDIFTGAGEKGLLTVTDIKLPSPTQTGRIQGFLRQTRAVENPPFTLPLIHAPPAKDHLLKQLNTLLASPAYVHFEVTSPRLVTLISRALAWFQDPEGFQGDLTILTEHPQIKGIGLPNVIGVSVEFKDDAMAWLHAIFQAAVADGVIHQDEIPATLSTEAGLWYYEYFPGEEQDAALRRYATVEIIKWIFSELHHRLAVQIAGIDVAVEDIKEELYLIQEILLETMDRERQGLVIRPEEVWEEVARQEELMPELSRKRTRQVWYHANQTVLERKYWDARGRQEDINRRIDHVERMLYESRSRLIGKAGILVREAARFLADVRYQIAMDAAERGNLSKARYILGQLEHSEGVESVFVPELRQALSNYQQFQAARQVIFQGNAAEAQKILESLKAKRARTVLIEQIASGVEKLSGLAEAPPVQSLTAEEVHRRISQQDRVQFLAGAKTAWVFKLNEYPNLVFKISLTGDNGAHYEDESLHLWQVARQAGYELQAVDGLMLMKIPGVAPVAYLEGVIVEQLAQPLPALSEHGDDDQAKEAAVAQAMKFQEQLTRRGIRWLDVKPDNLGEIEGEKVLIDNGFVYAAEGVAQASSLGAEAKSLKKSPILPPISEKQVVFLVLHNVATQGLLYGLLLGWGAGLLVFTAGLLEYAVKYVAGRAARRTRVFVLSGTINTITGSLLILLALAGLWTGSGFFAPFFKALIGFSLILISTNYKIMFALNRTIKEREAAGRESTALSLAFSAAKNFLRRPDAFINSLIGAWIAGPSFLILFWASLTLHELGHYLAVWYIKKRHPEKFGPIEFNLWQGFVQAFPVQTFSVSLKENALFSAAGPLMSLGSSAAAFWGIFFFPEMTAGWILGFAAVNFYFFFRNLLPIGSDGYKFAKAIKGVQLAGQVPERYSGIISGIEGIATVQNHNTYLLKAGDGIYWLQPEDPSISPQSEKSFDFIDRTSKAMPRVQLQGTLIGTDEGASGFWFRPAWRFKKTFYSVYKITNFPRHLLEPSGGALQEIVDRYARLAAGERAEPATIQRIKDNISSIQQAAARGRHKTLYYPASGRDVLRALLAYDAEQVLAVDTEDPKTEEALRQLGIQVAVREQARAGRTEKTIEFDLAGKKRQITQVIGKAQEIRLADYFESAQADIVHIRRPTGADEDISVPEDESRILPGIKWYLAQPAYDFVASGGFLVLQEGNLATTYSIATDLSRKIEVPRKLLEILKLKELKIVPHVRTLGNEGVIYQKTGAIPAPALDSLLEVTRKLSELAYQVHELKDGALWGGNPRWRFSDYEQILSGNLNDTHRFLLDAGVLPGDADSIVQDLMASTVKELAAFQETVKHYLAKLDAAKAVTPAGGFNRETICDLFDTDLPVVKEPRRSAFSSLLNFVIKPGSLEELENHPLFREIRAFAAAQISGASLGQGPEQRSGARWVLRQELFSVAGHFGADEKVEQIILVSDNSGTLTPDESIPLSGGILAGLQTFLSGDNHYLVVNSGDPLADLLDKSHKPLIDSFSGAGERGRYFVIGDGGSRETRFLPDGGQEVKHLVEDWSPETGVSFAKFMTASFYDRLKTRPGRLAELLAQVTDEEIEASRKDALQRLAAIESQNTWGGQAAGERQPMYRFDVFSGPFAAKYRNILGDVFIYDVGPKQTFRVVESAPDAYAPSFYQRIASDTQEHFSAAHPDLRASFGAAAPREGFVDLTRITKADAVEKVLREQVFPKLDSRKKTLVFVIGDGGNDIPTFKLFSGQTNVIVVPVLLNRNPDYAQFLPENARVGKDKLDGALEVIDYANNISGKPAAQTVPLELLKWQERELAGAQSLGRPEQEKALMNFWNILLSEAESVGAGGFGNLFRANARLREAGEALKAQGLAFSPWTVEIDNPALFELLKTNREKRLKFARQFVGDRLDRDGHLLLGGKTKGFEKDRMLERMRPALIMAVENIIQHAGTGFVFFFRTEEGFRAMILDIGEGMDIEAWARGEMSKEGDKHEALSLLLKEQAPVRILSRGREYDFQAEEGPRAREGLPERGTLVMIDSLTPEPQASSLGAVSREIPEINGVIFDALKIEDAGKVLAPVIYELDQKYQALRPRFAGPAEPMPSRNVLAVFRFTAPGVIKIALSPALAEKKGEVYQYGHSELANKADLSEHSFGFTEFFLALDKTDVRFRPDINGPGYIMYADVMHNQAIRTARMLVDILQNLTDKAGTRLYTEEEIAKTGFLMDLTKQNEIEQIFALERPGVRPRIDGGRPHRLLLTGVAGLDLIDHFEPADELSPELPVIRGKAPLAARKAIQKLNEAFEGLVPLGREQAGELMDRISMIEGFLTQGSYADAHKALTRALRYIQKLENPQDAGRAPVLIPDAVKTKMQEALAATQELSGQKPQGASLGVDQPLSRQITQFMIRWEAELRDPSSHFHKTALEFLAPIYLARASLGRELPYELLTPLADSDEDGVAQNVFRLLADADLIRVKARQAPRSLALLEAKASERDWPQDIDYYRFHYALVNLARLNAAMENPGSLPVFREVLNSAETPSGRILWRRWQTRALQGSLLIAFSNGPRLLFQDHDISRALHAFVKRAFEEGAVNDVQQFAAGAMAQADLFLIGQGRAPEFLPLIETADTAGRRGEEFRAALFNARSEIQSALIDQGAVSLDTASLASTVEALEQSRERQRSLDGVAELAAVVISAIRKGVRPADETLSLFKASISDRHTRYKIYVAVMGEIEAALIEQGMPGYFSPFLQSEFDKARLESPRAYSSPSENLDELIDALGRVDAEHLKQGRTPQFLPALHEMGMAVLDQSPGARTYGASARLQRILTTLARADILRIERGEEPVFVPFFEKGLVSASNEVGFLSVNALMRLNAAWIQQGRPPRLLAPVLAALEGFEASRYEHYQILPAFFFAVALEKGIVEEATLERAGLWAGEKLPYQKALVSAYLGSDDPAAFIASIEKTGRPAREADAVYQTQEFDLLSIAGADGPFALFTGRELGLLPQAPATRVRQVIKISDTAPTADAVGDGASQYERLLRESIEYYSTYDPARRLDESFAGREIQAALRNGKFREFFHRLAWAVEQADALEAGDLSMIFGDWMRRSPEMKQTLTGLLVEIAVLSDGVESLDRQTAIRILRSAEIGEVVLVAAESLTTSTAGGLPLYVSDLAEELGNLGIKATIMVPIFSDEARRIMDQHSFRNTGHVVEVPLTDGPMQRQRVGIYETKVGKVRVIGLVNEWYFNSLNRGHDSAYNGNGRQKLRFAYLLSMSTLQACEALHIRPNILHANEWSTAYLRTNLERFRQSPFLAGTKALYAVNSAQPGYDGTVYTASPHDRDAMIRFDLRADPGMNRLALGLPEGKDPIGGKSLIVDPNEPNHINPLATAFMSFDDVVTVSEGYYERSLWDDKEFGNLSWVLRLRQKEGDYGWIRSGFNKIARQRAFMAEAMKDEGFRQLMAGLGYREPVSFLEIGHDATRRQIARYLFDHLREKFQERLQEAAGLPKRKDAIVISSLSRINGQKGHQLLLAPVFDISNPGVLHDYTGIYPEVPDTRLSPEDSEKLADKVLDTGRGSWWARKKTLTALEVILTLNPDVQFVVVGSVDQRGDWYDQGLSEAERNFPDQIYYRSEFIRMEDPLYHLIYWGSRIFEASSWFEPFGLAPREAAAFGLLRHTSGRDGLADDVKTLDGLAEGFAPFNPLVWRDSLDRMLRVSREGREYREEKTGWTWSLWDEVSYLNLIHDDRWTRPGKNYVERYRRLLGKEPVGFLPALEILTAMNIAAESGRPDPANELLQAGFTPEEAGHELVESLKTLEDARLAEAIVRKHLLFLSRVSGETTAVLLKELESAENSAGPQRRGRFQEAAALLDAGQPISWQSVVEASSLGAADEGLIADQVLRFATAPFQPSGPEYWPEEKAASALAALQQFLKAHGRVIGDERGPFTDLTESLNASRVYSFKDGDFEIVDAEFMKSSLDHQYVVYKNGGIIGYGTFAAHPEFKRVENFRLAILEQRGAGNGFVALKLVLRMIYRAYGPKGLERIYAPAFSEMEEGVWQDSLASRAPLFMVYAGFDPMHPEEGFDQMISPLRKGELPAADKDRLNEALMETPFVLKLPAYSPAAASLGREIPLRAEMEFALKVALPHDQGGITEGILYINDETTLRWAMTELGLLEKPGKQNLGEAFQSLTRGELDRAIFDRIGLDENRLREDNVSLVLFPGVLDTENPADSDALAETFTGAFEAEDQVILVRRESSPILDALIRSAGRHGIKVRTVQDPLVSASSIDEMLKGEPPIIISPMSEKRDLEINFKGRKFKFNDQELHGRIDKVKVIGLLRKIADYPDKFNLIGLTAKDGYWEIGGAFADFIEKLYNESRAAQLQAKAA